MEKKHGVLDEEIKLKKHLAKMKRDRDRIVDQFFPGIRKTGTNLRNFSTNT